MNKVTTRLKEAARLARTSPYLMRIIAEDIGVTVRATCTRIDGVAFGDQYVVSWEDIEDDRISPLPFAIQRVNKEMARAMHPEIGAH